MVTLSYLQAPITKTYGNTYFYTFGTATSGVTYGSSNPNVATVSASGLVHVFSAGTTSITVGNDTGHITKTLTVNPAALTITANDATKAQGADNPPLSVSYSGFVNGDTYRDLTTLPAANTTATASSPAGDYPITASGAASPNYTLTYVGGTLTVTAPAGHSFAADDAIPEPVVNTALSPNEDGINDVLIVKNIEKYPDNRLTVMDREANKVFEVAGYDNVTKAFNGMSNISRKKQPAGTYFYALDYKVAGVAKRKTGYIVLRY